VCQELFLHKKGFFGFELKVDPEMIVPVLVVGSLPLFLQQDLADFVAEFFSELYS
jgi:hypothetical protein